MEQVPDDERYWTMGRIAAGVVVVSLVAFWIGVWSFALLSDEVKKNPDELADQTFVARADVLCQQAKDAIAALESPTAMESPAERADLLDQSNPIVASLVRQLAVVDVDNDDDRQVVQRWVADWEIYLADREHHVERLRTEGDVRFQVTTIDGVVISARIDGFARVNDMNACEVPLDL